MNTTLESVKLLVERRKNLIEELHRINSHLVSGYERCIFEIMAGRLSIDKLSEVIMPVVPAKVEIRQHQEPQEPQEPQETSKTPQEPHPHEPQETPQTSGASDVAPFMSPSEMNKLEETPETSEQEKQENDEIEKEHHPSDASDRSDKIYETLSTERTETTEIMENNTNKSKEPKEPTKSTYIKGSPNDSEENNIAPPREIHIPPSTREIEESETYQRAIAQRDKNIKEWLDKFNSKTDQEKRSFRDKYLNVLKQRLQELIPLPNKDGTMLEEHDVKSVVQRKFNIEYYSLMLKALQDYSINENKRSHEHKKESKVDILD